MASTCPDCGTAIEFEAHPVTRLTGTCSGCGHLWTAYRLDEGRPSSPGDGAPRNLEEVAEGGAMEDEDDVVVPVEGPPCPSCGASLTFRAGSGPGVEATCAGCGAVTQYVPAGLTPREPPARHGRSDDRPVGPGFRPANARPCRECGGALQFTTAPDGTISGECRSCGNRFTLPPRRESRGGWGPRPGRFSPGGGRGRFPSRGGGGSRPYGRPSGGGYRDRRPRDDDEDDRPRRRPRRT
jgi:hypothetical protein